MLKVLFNYFHALHLFPIRIVNFGKYVNLMLKKIFPAFLLFSITIISNAQVDGGRILMQQGQVFKVDVTLNSSITQQAMGQAIDFTVDGKGSHSYKVTNASDDFYSLHHEAQRISFLFNGMGTKKSFDSDNKKDLASEWGEPVKQLLAKKYDLIISTTGEVMKVNPESFPAGKTDDRLALVLNMLKDLTTVVEPPKKGDAGFFKLLPAKTAAVGDTWTTQLNSATERLTTVYTTESIGDSTITVKFKADGASSVKAEIMGMESTTSLTSVSTGTIILSKTTGIIMEKNSVTQSSGAAEVMGSSIPVTSKSTLKMIVTPG